MGAVTALALGLIGVGTANHDVTSQLVDTLIQRSEAELKDTQCRFIAFAIGLMYLGKQDMIETVTELLQVVPEPFRGFATVLAEACAYAGTGNVLKIQEMLHICSDTGEGEKNAEEDKSTDGKADSKSDSKAAKPAAAKAGDKKAEAGKSATTEPAVKAAKSATAKEDKKTKDWGMTKHAAAVLGIGMIAVGEDIGSEMAVRHFGNLYRYGDQAVRRAVPLALALTSISNPQLSILDTLSKYSHDQDSEVVHNSIFGMGTLTVQPYHSDRQLMSPVVMASVLSVVVTFLDTKTSILGKSHYLLYSLVPAIQPHMLQTVDENLKPLPVSVRVGQAVDVVGQAGKPKTITGFQTHTTPVLPSYGERAELATEEYIALTPVIEGFVILRKNPDYE